MPCVGSAASPSLGASASRLEGHVGFDHLVLQVHPVIVGLVDDDFQVVRTVAIGQGVDLHLNALGRGFQFSAMRFQQLQSFLGFLPVGLVVVVAVRLDHRMHRRLRDVRAIVGVVDQDVLAVLGIGDVQILLDGCDAVGVAGKAGCLPLAALHGLLKHGRAGQDRCLALQVILVERHHLLALLERWDDGLNPDYTVGDPLRILAEPARDAAGDREQHRQRDRQLLAPAQQSL